MTVKQLIEELKKFDENKICYEAEYGFEIISVYEINNKIFID